MVGAKRVAARVAIGIVFDMKIYPLLVALTPSPPSTLTDSWLLTGFPESNEFYSKYAASNVSQLRKILYPLSFNG